MDVIRHSNGYTYYKYGTSTNPPTNPKAGSPTLGNTVLWNSGTRAVTLVVPRRNPVDVDSWLPQSHLRTYSGPTTYEKPPMQQRATKTTPRNISKNDPRVVFLFK